MKLTTKLLLGATVIAGLSISAFAACATDVDFGSTDGTNGKNITGLKDPTKPQHAATKNYVDTIQSSERLRVTVIGNESNLTTYHTQSVTSGSFSYIISGGCYGNAGNGNTNWHGIISGHTGGTQTYSEVSLTGSTALQPKLIYNNGNVEVQFSNTSSAPRACRFFTKLIQ